MEEQSKSIDLPAPYLLSSFDTVSNSARTMGTFFEEQSRHYRERKSTPRSVILISAFLHLHRNNTSVL